MTDVEIRPITLDDDYDAQLDLSQRAFGVYTDQQAASWLHVARLRAGQGLFLGAFIDGAPAGAAMLHDMRQYWLGQPVKMAGVASVKVAPEHRGRGIGRTLMTEALNLIAERGYPLSALYPATTPIYRSLGWELAGGKHRFSGSPPARCAAWSSRTRRRAARARATRMSPSAGPAPPTPPRSSGSSATATAPPATRAR